MPKFRFTQSDEISEVNPARRSLLGRGLQLALGVSVVSASARAATLCADPDELNSADRAFRKYVEYTENYSKEEQTCAHCMFFKQGQGECGSCQVVAGSINAHGNCTSFSPKA